jgi:hypothetical protein
MTTPDVIEVHADIIRHALDLEAVLFLAPHFVIVHDKAPAPPWLLEFTDTVGHVDIDGQRVTVLYITDDPEAWALFAKLAEQ